MIYVVALATTFKCLKNLFAKPIVCNAEVLGSKLLYQIVSFVLFGY